MSRYYTAEWSARTRGAKWRTVTGKSIVTASSIKTAATRAAAHAERDHRLAAITLHLVETGIVPPLRCQVCGKSKQGGAHFLKFDPAAITADMRHIEPEGFHQWTPNR